MRKGITPIISIIVLLLITVSLAGAAYIFLGNYMTAFTGKAVQASGLCIGGDTAFITLTNMGLQDIDLTGCTVASSIAGTSQTCGDLTVVRTDSGGSMDASFTEIDGGGPAIPAATPDTLSKAIFQDTTCGTGSAIICKYAFTRAGENVPVEVQVSCSG